MARLCRGEPSFSFLSSWKFSGIIASPSMPATPAANWSVARLNPGSVVEDNCRRGTHLYLDIGQGWPNQNYGARAARVSWRKRVGLPPKDVLDSNLSPTDD